MTETSDDNRSPKAGSIRLLVENKRENDVLTAYISSMKAVLDVAESLRGSECNHSTADRALTDIVEAGLAEIRRIYNSDGSEGE